MKRVHLVFRSVGEQILGDFKRFTSKAVVKAIQDNPRESRIEALLEQFLKAGKKSSNVSKYQFWRHENKPIEVYSNKVVSEKINDIHQNPVDEGYVFRPEDYRYSSAVDYAGEKGLIDDVVVAK